MKTIEITVVKAVNGENGNALLEGETLRIGKDVTTSFARYLLRMRYAYPSDQVEFVEENEEDLDLLSEGQEPETKKGKGKKK